MKIIGNGPMRLLIDDNEIVCGIWVESLELAEIDDNFKPKIRMFLAAAEVTHGIKIPIETYTALIEGDCDYRQNNSELEGGYLLVQITKKNLDGRQVVDCFEKVTTILINSGYSNSEALDIFLRNFVPVCATCGTKISHSEIALKSLSVKKMLKDNKILYFVNSPEDHKNLVSNDICTKNGCHSTSFYAFWKDAKTRNYNKRLNNLRIISSIRHSVL